MRNKKGFTLIELLAVIVILGLLMAIAIPSITKYITQSRRKTVVSSIDGYVSSVVNSVNDQDYKFTEPNTIYAVPIECISLEKGGKNPFGKWLQANPDYWAYVLVQYDSENFSYTYGFTFKDSEGYGMYPTAQSAIDSKSSTQIKTGLELTKPESGPYTNIAVEKNWNGFNITPETQVIVLNSTEGNADGQTTCLLCQKGDNYEQKQREEEIKDLTLVKYEENKYFWEYREQIKNITFENSINVPDNAYKSWDVSETGKGKVMAYITTNSSDSSYYDLYIQGDGKLYANQDSSYLFYEFNNVDNIINIDILNVGYVTNMSFMFHKTGYNSTLFSLDLGNNFDTSNVTNMQNIFAGAGFNSLVFTLDLGDKFDTSNVTNMANMFSNTGYFSTVFTLDLGDRFNTSKVTDMSYLFIYAGYSSPVFTLYLGDKFDTSNVTNMSYMFYGVGYSSSVFTLDLGDKFDTGNVTDMLYMFRMSGYSSTIFTLDLGDKFDTSKITNMQGMFYDTGNASPVFTLDLGDKFDTSNVTDISYMFQRTGYSSTVFTLDLGDKFDTSKVTTTQAMFNSTGESSLVFTLDLGDKFDTSNVTNMRTMFQATGASSTVFTLDLGDKFDTRNVTNMNYMFNLTGYSSSKFRLDCSNWNVDNVTTHTNFNQYATSKVTPPTWVH